jgi:[ribosomal protein S5]-alanine N-acetyltransferase
MSTLNTPRLRLEPLTIAHADQLFAGLSDPALYTFVPGNPPASLEALRERYARIMRGPQDNPGELWLNWAARDATTGEYIGYIETSTLPDDHAYLAYFIFPGAQRKGYAREACEAVIRHLVREHRIESVVAEMDTRNDASRSLVESLGFRRVSEKRDADFFKGTSSHEYRYELDATGLRQ